MALEYPGMTKDVAREAVALVMPMILAMMKKGLTKRKDLNITVMHPRSSGMCRPIYEEHLGDKDKWEYPFDQIARGKGKMSWRTGKSSSYLQHIAPHLLVPSDTIYWGSDVLEDLVTACSGVQPYYDEMFSGTINLACRAICKREMEKFRAELLNQKSEANFLDGHIKRPT